MEAFYYYCHLAGPEGCPFYAETPIAIESRLKSILNGLKNNPIVVPATPLSGDRPQIVTYTSMQRLIATSLYRPLIFFPSLAKILSSLERGDGHPYVELAAKMSGEPLICEIPPPDGTIPDPIEIEGSADAFPAVMCGEADPMLDTPDEFQQYANALVNISKSTGSTMAGNFRLKCANWNVRAKWIYSGMSSIAAKGHH